MSDSNTDEDSVEPVRVEATIPKSLADALVEVHDQKIRNSGRSRGPRGGFDVDESGIEERTPGDKIVKLAVDGNISRRSVKDAIRKGRN